MLGCLLLKNMSWHNSARRFLTLGRNYLVTLLVTLPFSQVSQHSIFVHLLSQSALGLAFSISWKSPVIPGSQILACQNSFSQLISLCCLSTVNTLVSQHCFFPPSQAPAFLGLPHSYPSSSLSHRLFFLSGSALVFSLTLPFRGISLKYTPLWLDLFIAILTPALVLRLCVILVPKLADFSGRRSCAF